MRIIKTNLLPPEQREEVLALECLCNSGEGLHSRAFLSNEINFDQEFPCFWLGYGEQGLIAFLTVFIPTREEAEVTAFTHPDWRRHGCFSALLRASASQLRAVGCRRILFVTEERSAGAAEVLSRLGCTGTPEHSEYVMEHRGTPPRPEGLLELREAEKEDIPLAASLYEEVFGLDQGAKDSFVRNAVEAPDRRQFLTFRQGEPVGLFNFQYKGEEAFLYGLGLLPRFRGQGLGRELLSLALSAACEENGALRVVLEVDSHNPAALGLYREAGFRILHQDDYWLWEL